MSWECVPVFVSICGGAALTVTTSVVAPTFMAMSTVRPDRPAAARVAGGVGCEPLSDRCYVVLRRRERGEAVHAGVVAGGGRGLMVRAGVVGCHDLSAGDRGPCGVGDGAANASEALRGCACAPEQARRGPLRIARSESFRIVFLVRATFDTSESQVVAYRKDPACDAAAIFKLIRD